jgi:hypothetical protein
MLFSLQRIDRERQRLQHEVIELTATIDQVQKEKVGICGHF